MYLLDDTKNHTDVALNQLKHLKFEIDDCQHIVTLIDLQGFEIIKGYGNTIIEAINDLHNTLF